VNYETSKTQPNTYYGKTKLEAEILIRESQLDFLILRTDQPYNWIEKWQKENSVVRVLKHLNRKKALKEIIDWYNVPTYIPDLVKAIEFLIKKEASGIFNVVGDDYINRYDWSCNVADIFNLNKKLIIPIKSEELNIAVKRPNINLSNKKLVEKTGINMSGIYSGAISMKNEHIKTDK
jgi:dTDP-4-dehydrorhamnose reductase